MKRMITFNDVELLTISAALNNLIEARESEIKYAAGDEDLIRADRLDIALCERVLDKIKKAVIALIESR